MKNLNKFIFSALMIFCAKQLYAQKTSRAGDITIHISAHSFANKKYAINIYKAYGSIKIVYVTEDSTKSTEMKKDVDYVRITNSYMEQIKANSMNPNIGDSFRALIEKYTIYDRDSITFNTKLDTAYNNLLIRVANSAEEELLELEKNKNIVVLDGVRVAYQIINGSASKTVVANTPDSKRYPLLYNFLKSTLDIGRKQKLKTVVTKGFLWY